MKQISKKIKNIIISSTAGVGIIGVGVAASVPTAIALNNNVQPPTFLFDGKTFSSFDKLSSYMESTYLSQTINTVQRNRWSINDKGQTLYFNDPKLLRNYLNNKLQSFNAYSSYDLNNERYCEANGAINAQAFSQLHALSNDKDINNYVQTVYEGKNHSIWNSEQEAKDSYLAIHDAYYFNNMFFNNIEQLKLYLKTVYYGEDANNPGYQQAQQALAIVAPNKTISNSINQNDLFTNLNNDNQQNVVNAKNLFASFVTSHANSYLKFQNDNKVYDASQITEADLINSFKNPDYTRIYENDGYRSYVVDLNNDDGHDLFGPYYVASTKDIEQMSDRNQWQKIDRNDPVVLKEKDASVLAWFINNIFLEDPRFDNNVSPFNIYGMNDQLLSYFTNLKKFSIQLYKNFINMYNTLKTGKRFNLFYAYIISYKWLINNLISFKAPETLMKQTKEVFNEMAKLIDNVINLCFDTEILTSDQGDKLSFEKLLNFNNNNENLNTNIYYYVDEVSEHWPQFMVCLNLLTIANNVSLGSASALPFDYDRFAAMIDKTKSYDTNVFIKSNQNKYKRLYDLFSSANVDDFVNQWKLNFGEDNFKNNENLIKKIACGFTPGKFASLIASSIYQNSTLQDILNNDSIWAYIPSDLVTKIIKLNQEAYNHQVNPDNKNYITKEPLSFKNFTLIKMIFKMLPLFTCTSIISDLLNQLQTNKIDNENLREKLLNIIKKVPDQSFVQNYIVYDNLDSLMYQLKDNSGAQITYDDSFEKGASSLRGIGFFESILDNTLSITSNIIKLKKTGVKLTEAIKKTLKQLNVASSCFIGFNIALSITEILLDAFTPKTEYFSYLFDNGKGIKYVWNGGKKVTMFWGLQTISEDTISNMLLNPPLKIVDANSEEQYYFNGKKYSDLTSLKIEQLNAILNGQYECDGLTKVYSFIDQNNPSFNSSLFKNLGTVDDIKNHDLIVQSQYQPTSLIQYVYKQTFQELNKPKDQWVFHNNNFIFGNGITIRKGDSLDPVIDGIINNIKPTKIVQIPVLENNRPKEYQSDEEYNQENRYQLPGISWTINGVFQNTSNKKYLIIDPNLLTQSGQTNIIDDNNVKKIIQNEFYQQFSINSKRALIFDIKEKNNFDNLATNIIKYQIYQARLPNLKQAYFFNQDDALTWLISNMDFVVYQYPQTINIYQYKDQTFNSKEEFESFIIANMEVKNG